MGENFKILFAGPFGAGKTTAIEAISDIGMVRTEVQASDVVGRIKSTTTIALDYGVVEAGGVRVHLYGLPGQERFDFMWEILAKGALGTVLLIDNSRPFPLKDLQFFLNQFHPFVEKGNLVVGVTKRDLKPDPTLLDYHTLLEKEGWRVPLMEADPRNRPDVRLLILALLAMIDPLLGREVPHG